MSKHDHHDLLSDGVCSLLSLEPSMLRVRLCMCMLGRINSAYSTRALVFSPMNSGAPSRTPFLEMIVLSRPSMDVDAFLILSSLVGIFDAL